MYRNCFRKFDHVNCKIVVVKVKEQVFTTLPKYWGFSFEAFFLKCLYPTSWNQKASIQVINWKHE